MAQPYSTTSSTIDGGGGTSTNAQFSLSGTSGQPDAPRFVLQETLSLSPTNRVNSASGTNNPTVVSVTNAASFYRLK